MPILLLILILLAIFFLPQWWVNYTLRRYRTPREDIPGTGAELAQHLIQRFELGDIKVEQTTEGNDHFSPLERAVRLSPSNYHVKSLTAIAVAAHEVGHAIQHHRGETLIQLRTRMAGFAHTGQRLGAALMFGIPVIMLVTRAPSLGMLLAVAGLLSMGSAVLLHLITLPVEIDASFHKALPILRQGNYIQAQDELAVQRILRAAAYTYVAGALASLLNLGRWLALLRR
jgi:uncharacterized protein